MPTAELIDKLTGRYQRESNKTVKDKRMIFVQSYKL